MKEVGATERGGPQWGQADSPWGVSTRRGRVSLAPEQVWVSFRMYGGPGAEPRAAGGTGSCPSTFQSALVGGQSGACLQFSLIGMIKMSSKQKKKH